METNPQEDRSRFLRRWVLATVIGWIVGVFAVVAFSGLGELLNVGGQFGVGLGMSLAVGFFQWRVARKWFGASSQWIWATVIGMTIPFAVLDIIGALVTKGSLGGHDYIVMHLCVISGGLLAGVWQRRILQSHTSKANLWIPFSLAAWFVAELSTAGLMVPGHPESSLETIRNIGAIPLGGLVQGLVSGGSLMWLLRPETSNA